MMCLSVSVILSGCPSSLRTCRQTVQCTDKVVGGGGAGRNVILMWRKRPHKGRDPGVEGGRRGGLTYRPAVRRLLAPRFSSLHTNKNQKGDAEPMCTKACMSSRPETEQASTDSSCLSFTPDTCCKQTRPSVDMSPPSHSLTNPPASRHGNLYGNQRRQAVSAWFKMSSPRSGQ